MWLGKNNRTPGLVYLGPISRHLRLLRVFLWKWWCGGGGVGAWWWHSKGTVWNQYAQGTDHQYAQHLAYRSCWSFPFFFLTIKLFCNNKNHDIGHCTQLKYKQLCCLFPWLLVLRVGAWSTFSEMSVKQWWYRDTVWYRGESQTMVIHAAICTAYPPIAHCL